MPKINPGGTGRQEYIIGHAEPKTGEVSLAEIVKELQANSQAENIRIQGSPDNPSLVIATLAPELARQLQDLHPGIVVEENAQLH